jgi:hypothetical protein
MDNSEIQEILRLHKLWLDDEEGGVRADLSGAVLRGDNLYGANLCRADLYGANLCGANLHGAVLIKANLCKANLCETNLIKADLSGADLCGADLHGANLHEAVLCEADLHEAVLCGAVLSRANLSRADLIGVVLAYAQIPVAIGGPAGSSRRLTYYIYSCDEAQCGCFRGTLAEFAAQIEERHKDNPRWLREYRAMVEYFKGMREVYIKDREGGEG